LETDIMTLFKRRVRMTGRAGCARKAGDTMVADSTSKALLRDITLEPPALSFMARSFVLSAGHEDHIPRRRHGVDTVMRGGLMRTGRHRRGHGSGPMMTVSSRCRIERGQ
jgi:hypothetical protein